MAESEAFGSWAILELMGHRRLAGYLQECQIGGAGFLRIDIPEGEDQAAVTQFYAPSAVYAITPTTEETARAVARISHSEPVSHYEIRQLQAPAAGRVVDDDDDGLDDDESESEGEFYERVQDTPEEQFELRQGRG